MRMVSVCAICTQWSNVMKLNVVSGTTLEKELNN